MTAEELLETTRLGETSKVQFKLKFDNQEKIAAEMIAFANSRGGILLFGVEDKTGRIEGLDYKAIQSTSSRVSTIAVELCKPLVHILTEVVKAPTEAGNRYVLVVYVDEGAGKPYKDLNGAIWIKQGADKRRLTENVEIVRLYQQGGMMFAEEAEVYETVIDDLDERLFAAYFRKEFGRSYKEMGMTYERALQAKRILRNGRITLAGLLYFGIEPQTIRPAFTVKTISYLGNDAGGENYRSKPDDLKGTIPEIFKQTMMFLTSNLKHLQHGRGFNTVGELEIPRIVLEEVVQNALLHRDYFKNAPIRVMIFDNRVEIVSPGKLPNSLTVADLGYGNPVIRNNQIVAFGIHTMPFSGLGTGLKRAMNLFPDIQFINDVEGERFIVIMPRNEDVEGEYVTTQVNEYSSRLEEMIKRAGSQNIATPQVSSENKQATPQVRDKNKQVRGKNAQITPHVSSKNEQVTPQVERLLQAIYYEECGKREIMTFLGIRDYKYFKNDFLRPALKAGLIEMTQPDSPRSPTQKYRLTALGKKLKSSSKP